MSSSETLHLCVEKSALRIRYQTQENACQGVRLVMRLFNIRLLSSMPVREDLTEAA